MKTAIVQSQGGVTLAGGAAFTQGLLKKALALAPVMVAADSGADRLLALGHEPEAVIGDFDSISDQARECLAGRLHEIAEQETTDFDKALRSVAAPFVLGVGFDGARLDHGLAALNGLVRHPDRLCILLGAKDLVCLAPMEIEMRLRQPVGRLCRFVLGKCAVLVPFPRNEIDPLALHEMSRQTFPIAGVFKIHRAKGRLNQRKKAAERVLITRMGCCGQKDHPALWIAGKASEQFETLLLALVGSHTGMGLVHDHEIRACPREAFTTLFGLDVVEADHRVGVGIEQGLGQREAAFQPRGTT